MVWKLLRQHISIPQFIGFFFANLFGMLIVLLGFQFYKDIAPVFTSEDSFMKSDYLIINKEIGTGSTISGRSNTFTQNEFENIAQQPFTNKVGKFTSTEYQVDAHMGIAGTVNTWFPLFCHVLTSLCITLDLHKAIRYRRLVTGLSV